LKSSFFAIEKSEVLSESLLSLRSRIIYNDDVNFYHPERKNEFILGRVCASSAYLAHFGSELVSLPNASDRSPCWPFEVVGSITHNSSWVMAAVAHRHDLVGLGIDVETMGRTKLNLASHVRSEEDLKGHPHFRDEELLTLIFSFKESLYKALYPTVKKYFGFKDAAVTSLEMEDDKTGQFTIELLTDLNEHFGIFARKKFEGRFCLFKGACLSVLEILPKN
jgi:enterobactin synthetase component D